MANMGDAFKKAGVISDKQHRQLKHEERVHRKEAGREGLQEEQARRDEEAKRRTEAERERQKAVEKERQARRAFEEARARARVLIRSRAVLDFARGPRRFHYVERDGTIPFLMVGDEAGRRLEAGEFGIVEGGAVVARDTAAEIRALDASMVLFLNG